MEDCYMSMSSAVRYIYYPDICLVSCYKYYSAVWSCELYRMGEDKSLHFFKFNLLHYFSRSPLVSDVCPRAVPNRHRHEVCRVFFSCFSCIWNFYSYGISFSRFCRIHEHKHFSLLSMLGYIHVKLHYLLAVCQCSYLRCFDVFFWGWLGFLRAACPFFRGISVVVLLVYWIRISRHIWMEDIQCRMISTVSKNSTCASVLAL